MSILQRTTMIKQNKLGDVRVSEIGFGMWGISDWQPKHSFDEAVNVLNEAVNKGINFFDTAAVYGSGEGERLLSYVHGDIAISTKIPSVVRDYLQENDCRKAYPAGYIKSSIDSSLENLGRDYIDIMHLHNWNPIWDLEVFDELEECKRRGLVKAIGISLPVGVTTHEGRMIELLKDERIDSLMVHYNLVDQESRIFIGDALRYGKGILIKSPYKHGLLSPLIERVGSLPKDDLRRRKFDGNELEKIKEKIVGLCSEINTDLEHLPQVALQKYLEMGVSSVIVGIRDRETLRKSMLSLYELK